MDISWAVRCHITYNVRKGDMFTTRELLCYGNRNAIDQILFRLVKAGIIIRLAWGVFVRQEDYEDSGIPLPSPMEVAREKARAFCREVYILAEEVEEALATVAEMNRDDNYSDRKNQNDNYHADGKNIVDSKIYTRALEYENVTREWQNKNSENLREIANYARYGKARKAHGLIPENAQPPEKIKLTVNDNPRKDSGHCPTLTFITDGHSTSFYYGAIKIILKPVAPRKRNLKDSTAGVLIRLAWSLGKEWVKHNSLWNLIKEEKTKKLQKGTLRYNTAILPSWMTEALFWDLRPGSEYQGMWQRPAYS